MFITMRVRGTMEHVPEFEISGNDVFIRTDISRIPALIGEDPNDESKQTIVFPEQWVYDEQEMSMLEYLEYTNQERGFESKSVTETIENLTKELNDTKTILYDTLEMCVGLQTKSLEG